MGYAFKKSFWTGGIILLFTFIMSPASHAADIVNIFFSNVLEVTMSYNPGTQAQTVSIKGQDPGGNIIDLAITGIDRDQDGNQSSAVNYCKNFSMMTFRKPAKFSVSINGQGTVSNNGADNVVDLSDPTHALQCGILK